MINAVLSTKSKSLIASNVETAVFGKHLSKSSTKTTNLTSSFSNNSANSFLNSSICFVIGFEASSFKSSFISGARFSNAAFTASLFSSALVVSAKLPVIADISPPIAPTAFTPGMNPANSGNASLDT